LREDDTPKAEVASTSTLRRLFEVGMETLPDHFVVPWAALPSMVTRAVLAEARPLRVTLRVFPSTVTLPGAVMAGAESVRL
jgi:hypothetical protein